MSLHTNECVNFLRTSSNIILTIQFQQWSGADYADNLIKTVTGGVSSTSAMGKGVTESQFATKSKM